MDGSDESARWGRQFWVAIGLLAGFAALTVAMIWLAGGDDGVWQRRLYVFGAAEAIVFTATGWLFGREVGRSAEAAARREAATAVVQRDAARAEVIEYAIRVTQAETRTEAIRVRARVDSSGAGGSGPRDVSGRASARDDGGLRAFIEELLPEPARPEERDR